MSSGATALTKGLADVPWSHLTRVELVIDTLTGRRGGPYAEIGVTLRVQQNASPRLRGTLAGRANQSTGCKIQVATSSASNERGQGTPSLGYYSNLVSPVSSKWLRRATVVVARSPFESEELNVPCSMRDQLNWESVGPTNQRLQDRALYPAPIIIYYISKQFKWQEHTGGCDAGSMPVLDLHEQRGA